MVYKGPKTLCKNSAVSIDESNYSSPRNLETNCLRVSFYRQTKKEPRILRHPTGNRNEQRSVKNDDAEWTKPKNRQLCNK